MCLKCLCWLHLPGPFLELFDFHIAVFVSRLHGQSPSLLVGSKIHTVDIVSSDFSIGAWFHLVVDAELDDHEDGDQYLEEDHLCAGEHQLVAPEHV